MDRSRPVVIAIVLVSTASRVGFGQQTFIRGDANADNVVNISDAPATLNFLFLGRGLIPCGDAADSNDDGTINISDPIHTLGVLFLGSGEIPPPGSSVCGPDLTCDSIGCAEYPGCPKEVRRTIRSISVPVDSNDDSSHPKADNVWDVSAPPFPFDVWTGIGNLARYPVTLDDLDDGGYSFHDHVYEQPHVPRQDRPVFTYVFDGPTVVDEVEVIQHTNGITQIEGFVGNSLDALVSIGNVFGPREDVTGLEVFQEGEVSTFHFSNQIAGSIFQFVIRKTSLQDGYALYRGFLRNSAGEDICPANQ